MDLSQCVDCEKRNDCQLKECEQFFDEHEDEMIQAWKSVACEVTKVMDDLCEGLPLPYAHQMMFGIISGFKLGYHKRANLLEIPESVTKAFDEKPL